MLRWQASFWKPWNRNANNWAFFAVNNSDPVNLNKPQVLRCILCYGHVVNINLGQRSSSRSKKGLVTYDKCNGTTAMKKVETH